MLEPKWVAKCQIIFENLTSKSRINQYLMLSRTYVIKIWNDEMLWAQIVAIKKISLSIICYFDSFDLFIMIFLAPQIIHTQILQLNGLSKLLDLKHLLQIKDITTFNHLAPNFETT